MQSNVAALIAGFLTGVLIYSYARFGYSFGFAFLLFAFSLFVVRFRDAGFRTRGIITLAVFLAGASFGMIRYAAHESRSMSADFNLVSGAHINKEAFVVSEPEASDTGVRFVADVGGNRILVFAPRYPAVRYGERIMLSGTVDKPRNFNEEFDWEAYLAKDGIRYQMFRPRVNVVGGDSGLGITSRLYRVKEAFLASLRRTLPEPASALAGGLIAGGTDALGNDLEEDFRRVGLTHIVVLSGYNVTIIADALIAFFSFLPRIVGLSIGSFGIALFAIMVGAGTTVVRASVMALIAMFARATGNLYHATAALIAAGVGMMLYNPNVLVFDRSFQLSFLATLGLIYIVPIIEPRLTRVPGRFGLRGIVSATISAHIAVLPLLAYTVGSVSLVALPVNLLILPAIPLTMLASFLTGIAGGIGVLIAVPFSAVAYALLAYELFVVELFSSFSYAAVSIHLSAYVVALMYTGIVIFVWIAHSRATRESSDSPSVSR